MSHVLRNRKQIAQALETPTWSVMDLFKKEPAAENTKPSEKLLDKLLKQAGLKSVERGSEREKKLLNELTNQLQFVEHVSAVDTHGIKPLVRIGGGPDKEFDLEKAMRFENPSEVAKSTIAQETVPGSSQRWKPVKLAEEASGDFYVLHEGLRREE